MAERKEAKAEKDEAEKYQKLVREYVCIIYVFTFIMQQCLNRHLVLDRRYPDGVNEKVKTSSISSLTSLNI